MTMKNYLLSGLAAIVMNGCTTEGVNPVLTPASYCSKDTDCKGDRICDKGVCVDNGSGLDSKDVSGNSQLYVWGVGNCEVAKTKSDFSLLLQSKQAELIKSFTQGEIDITTPSNKFSCYASYQCALNNNLHLYSVKTTQGVRLVDNLYLLTTQQFQDKNSCMVSEWSKSWYKDCFLKGSDCPEP